MTTTQTDTSDEALVTAIRSNLCGFFRHFGRSAPDQSFENDRFTRWGSPIPHPWFNGVLCSQPPEADETFIDEAIEYFRTRNTRTFTWWMEPPLGSSAWEGALSKRGFGFSNDTPGMAMDLQSIEELPAQMDGLEIRFVEDEKVLRTWAETFTQGYG